MKSPTCFSDKSPSSGREQNNINTSILLAQC